MESFGKYFTEHQPLMDNRAIRHFSWSLWSGYICPCLLELRNQISDFTSDINVLSVYTNSCFAPVSKFSYETVRVNSAGALVHGDHAPSCKTFGMMSQFLTLCTNYHCYYYYYYYYYYLLLLLLLLLLSLLLLLLLLL